MNRDRFHSIKNSINFFAACCHEVSVAAGWWDKQAVRVCDGSKQLIASAVDEVVPNKLLLIHSEISEACEGHRKNEMDKHLPHREAMEVELADAYIRIGDLAAAKGYDLGGAVVEKMEYNETREDHKRENREKEGGKRY